MQAKKLYQNEVDFAFKREYVEAMTLLATKLPVHHMMLVGRDTGEGAVIWTRAIPTAATDSVWVWLTFWRCALRQYWRTFSTRFHCTWKCCQPYVPLGVVDGKA